MYLTFYSLTTAPFHITPDPKFLYLSPSHKEALAAIIYGIEQKKGFIAIVGAVGVGKTTILRSYLQTAQKKRIKIAYVFNARLSFRELLKAVYQELGIVIESDNTTEMANKLYEFLIDEYEQGNTVVLVVDEAQNMPIDTLESLRMLSNFETPTDKLIQIVLVGQPEFADLLNNEKLRPLNQRLVIRSTILPLTEKESLEYVRLRLSKAGTALSSVFTASALKKILASSKGIPRVLNVLCDNALITGFGYRQKPVTKKIAGEVVRDFSGVKPPNTARWWLSGALAVMVLCLGIMLFPSYQEAAFSRISMLMPGEQSEPSAVAGQSEPPIAAKRIKPDAAIGQSEPNSAVRQTAVTEKPVAPAGQFRATSVKAQDQPSWSKKPVTVKRVITRGDNLSKLALEMYGRSNESVIGLIRKENPQITNPNIILTGSTIVFPGVDGPGKQVDE